MRNLELVIQISWDVEKKVSEAGHVSVLSMSM